VTWGGNLLGWQFHGHIRICAACVGLHHQQLPTALDRCLEMPLPAGSYDAPFADTRKRCFKSCDNHSPACARRLQSSCLHTVIGARHGTRTDCFGANKFLNVALWPHRCSIFPMMARMISLRGDALWALGRSPPMFRRFATARASKHGGHRCSTSLVPIPKSQLCRSAPLVRCSVVVRPHTDALPGLR